MVIVYENLKDNISCRRMYNDFKKINQDGHLKCDFTSNGRQWSISKKVTKNHTARAIKTYRTFNKKQAKQWLHQSNNLKHVGPYKFSYVVYYYILAVKQTYKATDKECPTSCLISSQ